MHATTRSHDSSERASFRKPGSSTPLLSTSFPDSSSDDQRAKGSQIRQEAGLARDRRAESANEQNARFRGSHPTTVAARVAAHCGTVLERPEVAFTLAALTAVALCLLSGLWWMPEGGL